ncbi:MAG TPA: hypothetical protein VHO25_21545, partial [Polyangiaceae bacterium]|nr:hypothetical protein [Polyangiaceae bacterium]
QLMLARRDHPDVHRSQTEEVEWQDHGDGRMSQFTVTIPNEVRVNARFSFLRAVDQFDFSGYDLAHIPFRSPTLVAHTMAYGERLERAVKDGKGFEELAEALRQEMEQEAKQK